MCMQLRSCDKRAHEHLDMTPQLMELIVLLILQRKKIYCFYSGFVHRKHILILYLFLEIPNKTTNSFSMHGRFSVHFFGFIVSFYPR